ncbi:MAG: RNA ligase family protein [Chloroflexi bacterium]|nr:RNA ligase family protein [Chloroflexota bacterium]
MLRLHKYPRTPHVEGSRPQPGDEELASVPFRTLAGRHLVVEEKLDGANVGVSFGPSGELRLQSRGHFLDGGQREQQFNFFKAWAACHQARLFEALGTRYVVYGEWLYAKHTLFYDALTHYFLEFDVLDTGTAAFLATHHRRALLVGLPVVSVPVLHAGPIPTLTHLRAMIGPSRFKSPAWHARLRDVCVAQRLDPWQVLSETDPTDTMEGLYVKVEADGRVLERYKLLRASFLDTVAQSGSHWLDRPIVPNQLRPGVDLFGELPG